MMRRAAGILISLALLAGVAAAGYSAGTNAVSLLPVRRGVHAR